MGAKWSTVSTSTYADGSPSDDGSATAANRVKYATIKTDLTDPLDTAIDSIVSKLDQRFDESGVSVSTNYTTVASDHARIIEITSGAVTLLAAASAGAGYRVGVYASGGSRTVNRSSTDTINGATSVTVESGAVAWFVVNAAGTGYIADLGQSFFATNCCVIAYLDSDLNTPTGTPIELGASRSFTELKDTGSNFTAATGRFAAPIGGVYDVSFRAILQALSAAPTEQFYAFVGDELGNPYIVGSSDENSGSVAAGDIDLYSSGSGKINLSTGQIVTLWVFHQVDGTRAITGGSRSATSIEIIRIL